MESIKVSSFHDKEIKFDENILTGLFEKSNKISDLHKDIFACLFSIHNIIISLSCHEQVCLSGLRFERYFSHHRAR